MWDELEEIGLIRRGVPIRDLTSYKLGGPARYFSEPATRAELERVLAIRNRFAVPVLVVGRGSNLVVSDRGFDGLVIRLAGEFSHVRIEGDLVIAGAAVSLPVLARTVTRAGWGGLEFYVGIPGSVGGAVVMNAGCFGTETCDVLDTAEIVQLASGAISTAGPARLAMGYRTTAVTSDELVLSARLRLVPTSREAAEDKMREITRWRKDHQPGGTLNAGSVFKNPPGDAAGRIIDTMGLKGFGTGRVRVSERHANFFVAESGATAQEVWDLVQAVRRRVFEHTGIRLEPEIRFAGDFESVDEVRT